MNASLERRISITSNWESSRISVLDSQERYEDSYAITQEFQEWITSIEENPEFLESTVLKFPQSLTNQKVEEASQTDEMLEI